MGFKESYERLLLEIKRSAEIWSHREAALQLALQNPHLKHLWWEAVIELSAEYKRVYNIDIHASAHARSVIEIIMKGDWKDALDCVQLLKFDRGDPEEYNLKYRELWAPFLALTEMYCREAERINAGGEYYRRGN